MTFINQNVNNPLIYEINDGIAYTVHLNPLTNPHAVTKYIEVNAALKRYPALYLKVIDHEMRHMNSKSPIQDLWIDIVDMFDFKKGAEILGFCITNPSSLTSFIPINVERNNMNKIIVINWASLIFWILVFAYIMIIVN